MSDYTEQQIEIAKSYEDKAFAALNNGDLDKFDEIMQQFEQEKMSWGSNE